MKLIITSNSSIDMIAAELNGNEPGLVVLPEGCWDGNERVPDEFIDATRERRVSIIGTMCTGQGYDVAYLLKGGSVKPVAIYFQGLGETTKSGILRMHAEFEAPHDVSPTNDPILAIIRQCSEIYSGSAPSNRKVDLLCVPSSIDHALHDGTRKIIVDNHRASVSERTLMLQPVLSDIYGSGIFRLPDFKRFGEQKDQYIVHSYS
ncbi:hypothetical protein HYS31_01945 [Candidatus Woesearchaeota archaeon]|nr:hypothetical protein [Candidatus Woesearchaeota archaeon]